MRLLWIYEELSAQQLRLDVRFHVFIQSDDLDDFLVKCFEVLFWAGEVSYSFLGCRVSMLCSSSDFGFLLGYKSLVDEFSEVS